MFPQPFVDLLKQWIVDADHPGITQVRTCAEVGRWEHPVGVRIALGDGWALLMSVVRTSPPGGDPNRPAVIPGSWADDEDYRRARKAADAETARTVVVKSPKPQATTGAVLAVVLDAIKRADHPGVASAEVSARDGRRPILRVTGADGSTLYGQPVGWFTPGAVTFAHPAYDIPNGWY